jgi:hypothetical protein
MRSYPVGVPGSMMTSEPVHSFQAEVRRARIWGR